MLVVRQVWEQIEHYFVKQYVGIVECLAVIGFRNNLLQESGCCFEKGVAEYLLFSNMQLVVKVDLLVNFVGNEFLHRIEWQFANLAWLKLVLDNCVS